MRRTHPKSPHPTHPPTHSPIRGVESTPKTGAGIRSSPKKVPCAPTLPPKRENEKALEINEPIETQGRMSKQKPTDTRPTATHIDHIETNTKVAPQPEQMLVDGSVLLAEGGIMRCTDRVWSRCVSSSARPIPRQCAFFAVVVRSTLLLTALMKSAIDTHQRTPTKTAATDTCCLRPMITTFAPCSPICRAISKQMPEPPPVTRATRPFNTPFLNPDICMREGDLHDRADGDGDENRLARLWPGMTRPLGPTSTDSHPVWLPVLTPDGGERGGRHAEAALWAMWAGGGVDPPALQPSHHLTAGATGGVGLGWVGSRPRLVAYPRSAAPSLPDPTGRPYPGVRSQGLPDC